MRRLAVLLAVLAGILGARTARAVAAYEVLTIDGKSHAATSVGFARDAMLLVTATGAERIPLGQIDFYSTFRSNMASGATNVVAFTTGALMRYDRLEIHDGMAHLTVGTGGTMEVPESLIDFEASVREGAMVKLPEGGTNPIAVSRSGAPGGSAAPDAGGGYDEVAPPPDEETPPRAVGAAVPARRRPPLGGMGARRGVGAARAIPDRVESRPSADSESAPQQAFPDESGMGGGEMSGDGGPASPPPEQFPQQQGGGGVVGGNESGEVLVSVYSDFTGELGGLQVTLGFPARALQVVGPPTYTGFATGFSASSGVQAGSVRIAGVMQDANAPVQASPGEFLVVRFAWTGQAPRPSDFNLGITASDPHGTTINFPARLAVR
jgi:hypothetical protein